MNGWIIFWTVIIALGVGSFVVLVVTVIPLGGRDVWELLRRLGAGSSEVRSPTSDATAARHPGEPVSAKPRRKPGEDGGGDPGTEMMNDE